MTSCALTFRLLSPLLPCVHLWRRRVTANSWKHPATLPRRGGAGSSHIPERRVPGDAERSGARRYPWLYRAGPGRSSGRDSLRSRRRRVPLRQLHVKSPAAAPGAPMRAGAVSRLPGTAQRRGFPAASRHRDVCPCCRSPSLSYSRLELQELWLCSTRFAKNCSSLRLEVHFSPPETSIATRKTWDGAATA